VKENSIDELDEHSVISGTTGCSRQYNRQPPVIPEDARYEGFPAADGYFYADMISNTAMLRFHLWGNG